MPSKLAFLTLILIAYIRTPNFVSLPCLYVQNTVFPFGFVFPLYYFKTDFFFCHINFTRLCIPDQSPQNWYSPIPKNSMPLDSKQVLYWTVLYCQLLRCFKREIESFAKSHSSVSEAHSAPCRISPWNITIWDKQVLKAVFLKLELESQLRKVPLGCKWRSQNIRIKPDSDMLGSFS